MQHTPQLNFALSPPSPVDIPQKTELKGYQGQLQNSSFYTKSFDKRNSSPKSHRRTQSSFANTKDMNYSVILEGSPITRQLMLSLKKVYDSVISKGICTGKELCKGLRSIKIENFGKLVFDGIYSSFGEFIAHLFAKADSGQVARMLALINSKAYVVMTPIPEKARISRKSKIRMVQKKKIEMVFRKFDLNGDGVIDVNELKTGLEPAFTDDTINELYSAHRRRSSGIKIEEFTKMFMPPE